MDFQKILKELEEGTAILVDVREPIEWEEDHLVHSQLCPLTRLVELAGQLDKDKKIYVHCRRGGRAKEAAEYLKPLFGDVEALKCPFEELKEAGL